MVNLSKSEIKISFLEKCLVNFALPSDFVFHAVKSNFVKNEYSSQTYFERIKGIYDGKIEKYHKLLVIKEENSGKIPYACEKICKATPCGRMRLFLSNFR